MKSAKLTGCQTTDNKSTQARGTKKLERTTFHNKASTATLQGSTVRFDYVILGAETSKAEMKVMRIKLHQK
jgi:hypothetical protein